MVAIFVDEKASVPFSLIPSLSTSIGIHKLLLLRRRRHRLFVFSFGPRCQLTAILDDGRPLCLLDAALRPPAAKHSHSSRLAASSSSNHSPRFSRWKDTFSSLPSIRYRIILESEPFCVQSSDARRSFSRCGNMQIPRFGHPKQNTHANRISTIPAALDVRIYIHSSLSLSVSFPEMGRRATEPTRPDRRCRTPRS
ncbi:hypothetical protein CLIM01_09743 [Colletotrichum limetticola]|uniref:Uncharacterized protein n=1 Tax=Colletotrichum limetticola TaxID=1209924 RepID=A0ABQ9PMZ2_9PEZI|nr:hypothetical protein CLIM01_09743 [Colletotrichum limetticola]